MLKFLSPLGTVFLILTLTLFSCLVVLRLLYNHEHKLRLASDQKAAQAVLRADAAEASIRVETRLITQTKTIYVKAKEGQNRVSQIDPQCTNGDALVAGFRQSIDGLRSQAGSASGDSASVSP